jgi:hypothetical protein
LYRFGRMIWLTLVKKGRLMGGVWEKLPSIRSITTIPNQCIHYQPLQHILLQASYVSDLSIPTFRWGGTLQKRKWSDLQLPVQSVPMRIWLITLRVRTPFMARCTRNNIMWPSLSVTCHRSVVFFGYSDFLHQ